MDGLIDYARPMMTMESLLREMHEYCQAGQFDKAQAKGYALITEARLLQHTLQLMDEAKTKRQGAIE